LLALQRYVCERTFAHKITYCRGSAGKLVQWIHSLSVYTRLAQPSPFQRNLKTNGCHCSHCTRRLGCRWYSGELESRMYCSSEGNDYSRVCWLCCSPTAREHWKNVKWRMPHGVAWPRDPSRCPPGDQRVLLTEATVGPW